MSKSNNKKSVLLNYYTRNMAVHATIIVAVMFGLFSVLGIAHSQCSNPLQRGVFAFTYWIFWILGTYEVSRYKHYGKRAKELAEKEFGAEDMPPMKGTIFGLTDPLFRTRRIYSVFFLFMLCPFLGVYIVDVPPLILFVLIEAVGCILVDILFLLMRERSS